MWFELSESTAEHSTVVCDGTQIKEIETTGENLLKTLKLGLLTGLTVPLRLKINSKGTLSILGSFKLMTGLKLLALWPFTPYAETWTTCLIESAAGWGVSLKLARGLTLYIFTQDFNKFELEGTYDF